MTFLLKNSSDDRWRAKRTELSSPAVDRETTARCVEPRRLGRITHRRAAAHGEHCTRKRLPLNIQGTGGTRKFRARTFLADRS
jgi:hypothetical protein